MQADIRAFLLAAPLDLTDREVTLEAPAGDGSGRRIDVEVGSCVIEVKKDLRVGRVLPDAVDQIAGYLRMRTQQTGGRYVGVLTDGTDWRLYTLAGEDGAPTLVSVLTLAPDTDAEPLTDWLEAVLATTSQLPATPAEVVAQLGAASPGFQLDRVSILAAYLAVADHPEVSLKRALWAKLLTTALGSHFRDETGLFAEHTYLVTVAELVAHAVAGFDLSDPSLSPRGLVSGDAFRSAGISGVVEADFFDWLIDAPGGEALVRGLARRIARFDWTEVEHDILKVLYESVIGPEQRHSLGEYYTPDWLADRVVREVVPDPLTTTVLDPACGSGTFVFHAVRNFIAAAEVDGRDIAETLTGATRSVFGMDVHPVAVTLARVTYLLALGADRVRDPSRPALSVPVYLGDSLQWEQAQGVVGAAGLSIEAGEGGSLLPETLKFPVAVMADPGRFDQLVSRLTDMATNRTPGTEPPNLRGVFAQFAVAESDRSALADTFAALCRLNDDGRDHIWGYYVRNLARPLWLNREDNRVGALVGNPPWLSYRYMPAAMQERFRAATKARGMWAGAKVATQQDLSAYFVARSAELYLAEGGAFGFVMPFAVLSRLAYEGFRSGRFASLEDVVWLKFVESWDLHKVQPDPFPVPCSVILGHKCGPEDPPPPMPTAVLQWSGRLPASDIAWDDAKGHLFTASASVQIATTTGPRSPYSERFTQGANLVPRMLVCVVQDTGSPLGAGAGRVAVRSHRTTQEKAPWKSLPDLHGHVERQFVFPVHLGSTVTPYRLLEPWKAVLPVAGGGVLSDEGIDAYPDLSARWGAAEAIWQAHRSDSTKISLTEQVDWQGKLGKQFPVPTYRVVYTKSGTKLAAATVTDQRQAIDHKLYWAPAATLAEARYLTAIFNSTALLTRVQGLQSRGQFGARDFDTYVFAVPFPEYDSSNATHVAIVAAAERAEEVAARVPLPESAGFQRARKLIREALAAEGIGAEVEAHVEELFSTLTG